MSQKINKKVREKTSDWLAIVGLNKLSLSGF